jgi:type II secretory pathway pseudopilin PulG
VADSAGVERAFDQIDRRPPDEGSTLVEQLIAITIVTMALLALLGALGAAARGVSSGRQRSIAVSLAKQALENLQGAAYPSVAMNLSSPGLTADPLVTGSSPNLRFEGELLVSGSTVPYKSTTVASGATFTLRTFITAVSPPNGTAYRRITVMVEWAIVPSAPPVKLRFSSLVFPLNYTSYPASNGSASVTGGLITLTGRMGGQTLDDVHVGLPAARTDTNVSTLRTSIGSAVSSTSHIDVGTGTVGTSSCPSTGEPGVGDCPTSSTESVADNNGSSTTGNWSATANQSFAAASLAAPNGLVITTPAGLLSSRASTDLCGLCGFGDADGVPWAEASVTTTTGSTATFANDHGNGVLAGELWSFSAGWSSTASVDHDPAGGGIVTSSAHLVSPGLRMLTLSDAPAGFAGVVVVDGFAASSTIASGYTLAAPIVTSTSANVNLWDGELNAYRTLVVTPGVAFDESASGTIVAGDHLVTFTARVHSRATSTSMVGSAPRTDAVAQIPSVLVASIDVSIVSQTTSAVTDEFSLAVDYGYVAAHGEWIAKAA